MDFKILKRGNSSFVENELEDQEFRREPELHQFLFIEQKRSERSKKPFVLMLLDVTRLIGHPQNGRILQRIKKGLADCLRDTDMRGWYRADSLIGIIFTEIQDNGLTAEQELEIRLHCAEKPQAWDCR